MMSRISARRNRWLGSKRRLWAGVLGVAAWAWIHAATAQTAGNLKPVVDAGPDRTINLPGSVSLSGTVSDDGLPGAPQVLLTKWIGYSGPGSVAFENEWQLETTASFSNPGTYILVLAAHDGELLSYDYLTVTVTAFSRLNPAWRPGQLMPHVFVTHHHGPADGDGDWLPRYASIATVRVNASGRWSQVFGATPPGAGDVVLVPAGVTLTYDAASSAALRAVVVEGAWIMAPDRSSQLRTGTLYIEKEGAFTAVPNDYSVKTSVVFSGAVNTVEDPGQMSIGMVVNGGQVQVVGTARASILGSSSNAVRQARTLTVQGATGWQPGDTLIFPDQRADADPTYWNFESSYVTQTERATIQSISGSQVTLQTALRHSHGAGAPAPVAMVSRNVAFLSDLTAGNSRAHILFGGHARVTFVNAMLVDLGRTTVALRDDTVFDAAGVATRIGTNQRARYALHAHHVHEPVLFQGNAVFGFATPYGSERFGIVLHDSRGDVLGNVVVGARGAGIFLEDGVETGQVAGNVVIGSGGGSGLSDDERFANTRGEDLGAGGFGIWARGPLAMIRDNVAAGYFSRAAYGYFVHPSFVSGMVPDIPGTPAALAGKKITLSEIPIQRYGGFERNLAYGLFPIGLDFAYSTPPEANVFRDFRIRSFGTEGRGVNVVHCFGLRFENPVFSGGGGGTGIHKENGRFSWVNTTGGSFDNWTDALTTFPGGNVFTGARFKNNEWNISVVEGSGKAFANDYNATGLNYQLFRTAAEVPGAALAVPGIEGFALQMN